jgi:CRISPR-associated protein Csb1
MPIERTHAMPLTHADLVEAVTQDAAFRRRRRLQPVGGPGDTLFPPTYPGEEKNDPPRHVFERRRIAGSDVWCVLIDSVQSQANRMEEALLEAAREGAIPLPRLTVDFAGAGLETVGEITSLEAPHRVFDAILRDSLLDGKLFKDSPVGQRLALATARDASAILETSPTSLLFGVWNSTGEGGGLGAKFPRTLVSEIIGVGVSVENAPRGRRDAPPEVQTSNRRTGSRIDPLGVVSSVKVYQHKDNPKDWTPDEALAARDNKKDPILYKPKDSKKKAGTPALINHGNIAPSVQALGITCDRAEQTVVITLAGLRRLRFGGPSERDTAGRALIAALGLVALLEQDAQGYALRSRCDLVCDGPAPLEIVHADGTTQAVTLTRDEARALYAEAVKAAEAAGFTLSPEPVRLTPQDKLVHIVRESMHRALAGEAHPEEGE